MTPASPAAPRPSSLPAWAALCFFASGAAGLLYEIAWSKQLAYVLGSSLHAVATVTAAFLAGLALGARVLGVPIARRGDGARTYALLELGVALLGVALLPLLRGMEPVFGQLYRQFGGEGAAFAAVRFAMLFALLIPPAALMGATLPVLVEHFEREVVGPALARLYALNTFGAVAGSALAGFALMPGIGLAGTTYVAAAVNVAVAALAWAAGGPRGARAAAAPAKPAATAPARGGALALAALFALSGFAAMVFQIAWVRLYGLVFGSSVYSFAGVLGVYLFGLALGSAAIAFVLARGARVATFAKLQLAIAATAAAGVHFFAKLPDQMFELATRSAGSWSALFTGQLGMVAMLLLVPCALLGAVFPVAAKLLQRGDGGHAAGFAYAVNTAGTILGSLVAGFVLVPSWGVQGAHVAALALSGAIGLAALAIARARGELKGGDLLFAGVAALAAAALAWGAPKWDPALMSAGVFRPQRANELATVARASASGGSTLWRATRAEKTLYYREGVNGSVLVGTDEAGTDRWLQVGGKIDASLQDMETQVLLGLLPSAMADTGARTLVVGLGSGYTLAASLAAGAGPTEVVELERGVVEASEFFHEPGANPLRDPRVTLVVGDARTHLAHTRATYDVIVSEPSNPWIAGVNNLFTVDYYRRVKARLAPDGVFCQWMQLYEISPETVRSMLASFLEVFPEGDVFTVWRAVDVLLVANPSGRSLSLERLGGPAARRMLAAAHIAGPEDVASYWTGPFSALAPLAKGATLNRDDRPVVEYRAPRDLVAVGHAALRGDPGATRLVPFERARPRGAPFAGWDAADWHTRRVRRLAASADSARARAAVAGAREEGLGELAGRLEGEVRAGLLRVRAEALLTEAMNAMAMGHETDGLARLERALATDPGLGRGWLLLADRRRVARDYAGALDALARIEPGADTALAADASHQRGLASLGTGDTLGAQRAFVESQRLQPGNPRGWSTEARLRASRGDAAGAKAVLRRGLEAVPGSPELQDLLRRLGE